ncbi:MAG TPA: molybdopterin cofactor-binding domain-containing protein [Gaiellaceae bacterium]|nr:molybdopterin cofactor-binding domain-containing protein [Gaiellaceae bacterium]
MTGLLHERELSRKTFLKGGGALVVGFSLAGTGLARAAAKVPNLPPDLTQVDSWLAINADNTVSLFPGFYEFGQGTWTGFVQIVAEELDVPVASVKIPLWDSGGPNPFPNEGTNAASNGMANGGPVLRQAAATARQALLGLASSRLGVPASQLSVTDGVVSGGGKSVKYSDLLGGKPFNTFIAGVPTGGVGTGFGASPTTPGTPAPLKPVSQYKVVGTRVPRIDIPDKVTGTYTYIQNVRVPGMLHGRAVRPLGQADLFAKSPAGGPASFTVESVDESSIAHIAGARVLRKGNFVGVVAPTEYDAIQAAAQLKVKWSETDTLPGSGNLYGAMRSAPTRDAVVLNDGDVDKALASAAKVLTATYEFPFQIHGPIGPCCAIADIRANGGILYVQGQDGWGFRNTAALVTGLGVDSFRVVHFEGSSTYNPGPVHMSVSDAALLSQLAGKPVRVQTMRWDENGYSPMAQSNVADLRAGLDASGRIVAYDVTSYMMVFSNNPTPASLQLGLATPVDSASFTSTRGAPDMRGITSSNAPAKGARIESFSAGDQYTAITNRRITGKTPQSMFKLCPLRAPTCIQACWASESMIDELAHAANMDAYQFRAKQTSHPGWLGVLDAVAKASGWQPRVSASKLSKDDVVTGRGIAIGGENHAFTDVYAGVVAEVEVNKKTGKIVVTHLYGAQDSGFVVNPGLIENQLVGMLTRGVSRTLYEEVRFNKRRVTSTDWVSYPVLRFKEHPAITAIAITHPDEVVEAARSPVRIAGPRYRGAGESIEAVVPAAIGNAVFDATGVRMRQVPLTPAKVRAALEASGVV